MNKMRAQKSFNTAQKAFHLSTMKMHEKTYSSNNNKDVFNLLSDSELPELRKACSHE